MAKDIPEDRATNTLAAIQRAKEIKANKKRVRSGKRIKVMVGDDGFFRSLIQWGMKIGRKCQRKKGRGHQGNRTGNDGKGEKGRK